MKLTNPTDLDRSQWEIYLEVKKAIKNHRFTLVKINETEFGVDITLNMTKSDKPIDQIESELNGNQYR